MRHLANLSLLLLAMNATLAQINVGNMYFSDKGTKDLPAGALDALSQVTTYLIIRDKEEEWIPSLQADIDRFWTINPIKIITLAEQDQFIGEGKGSFAAIQLGGVRPNDEEGLPTHTLLTLYMSTPANGKNEMVTMATAVMHLSPGSYHSAAWLFSKHFTSKMKEYLYTEAEIDSWSPGMILATLRSMDHYVKTGRSRFKMTSETNKKQLASMKKSRLYVSDHVLKGSEKPLDERKLMKEYTYPYEIITKEALSEKLRRDDEAFFYLFPVRSGNTVYTAVYKSDTGEIIYAHTSSAREMGARDISKLAAAMSK
jgi:hypothetical protein